MKHLVMSLTVALGLISAGFSGSAAFADDPTTPQTPPHKHHRHRHHHCHHHHCRHHRHPAPSTTPGSNPAPTTNT